MANETNPADLGQGLVRENWGDIYIKGLYEKNYTMPFMSNVTGIFNKGDTVNVPVAPVLTVGAIAADGSLNPQVDTHTNVQVVIDKNKDCTVVLTGITMAQAEAALQDNFPSQAADAVKQKMELDALALQSDATNTAIGDGLAAIGEDELLAAIGKAITAKLPILSKPEDFCFALADNLFTPIRKQKFLDYNVTGVAGQVPSQKLDMPSYGGIAVRFSTQVATSASVRKNMLFHKSAFAWATQRNVEPKIADMLASGKDAKLLTCIATYGVKTVVASRFWVIQSAA